MRRSATGPVTDFVLLGLFLLALGGLGGIVGQYVASFTTPHGGLAAVGVFLALVAYLQWRYEKNARILSLRRAARA